MPRFGLLLYLLFWRDWKAFSKQRRLLFQGLQANAHPLVSPMLARQAQTIAQIKKRSPKTQRRFDLPQNTQHA